MITTLHHNQIPLLDRINQPVFIINSTRPHTGQLVLEWFGLTDTGKRLALDCFDQFINALENAFVGSLPIKIIIPSRLPKTNQHYRFRSIHAAPECGRA